MGRCGACEHWQADPDPRSAGRSGFGACEQIGKVGTWAIRTQGSKPLGVIYPCWRNLPFVTEETFGCELFERRHRRIKKVTLRSQIDPRPRE